MKRPSFAPTALRGAVRKLLIGSVAASVIGAAALSATASADETCASPYMKKITGQEDFVYVWTLGAEGIGDEQDKLVTVDVNPKSDKYGKVVNTLSVGGRNEAHAAPVRPLPGLAPPLDGACPAARLGDAGERTAGCAVAASQWRLLHA